MAMHYNAGRKDLCFNEGDLVFIENRDGLRIPGLDSGKLSPRRFGPFPVEKLIGKGACRLTLPDNYKMHNVISNRHLTKSKPDEFNRIPERPPALVDDGLQDDAFEVEAVIDKRKNRKHWEYLVKWRGYPVWESTWIHENQRDTFEEAILDFEHRQTSTSSLPGPPIA